MCLIAASVFDMSVQVRVNGGDRQSERGVENNSCIVAADMVMAG